MAKPMDPRQFQQMLDKIDAGIVDEEGAVLEYTEMSKLAGRLGFHGPAHILTLMAADEARHKEHLETMRQMIVGRALTEPSAGCASILGRIGPDPRD